MRPSSKLRTALTAILLSIALGAPLATSLEMGAHAQSVPDTDQVQPLFSVEGVESRILAQTPPAPITGDSHWLVLERITISAETTLPERTTTGPEILVVEAGSVSLEDSFGFATPAEEDESLTLNAGSTYVLANDGFVDATVLRLSLVPQPSNGSEATPGRDDTSATPTAVTGEVELLLDRELDSLPEGDVYVYLATASFQPGASSGTQDHSGPLAVYVESGTLSIQSPSGITGKLGEGQSVVLPAAMPLISSNETETEADLLVAGVAEANAAPLAEVIPEPTSTSTPTQTTEPTSTTIPSPTTTPSPTQMPTHTPTSTPTPEPTHTPTPEPTHTSTPEPTQTVPPTPTPAPGSALFEADLSQGLEQFDAGPVWNMVGGMLVSNGSADAVVYAPFNPGDLADYAVEVEIQFIDPRPNSRDDVGFGIIARNNGVGGIDAYYWNNRTSNVAGSRVEAGLRIRSGDDKIAGQEFLLDGEWHKYRLELEGNQIRLYVDGGLVLFAQDNRYLDPGVAGLWVSEGAQINVRSFRIVTLGGEITGPNAEVASDITSSQSDQGISSTGSVDVFSLLPDVDVVGDGLFLIDARYRSLDELVQNYPSPSDTKARFQSWGWRANAICNFAPVPAGAWVEGLLNGVYVSIHQFDGPDHAALALDWSLDGQAVGTPLYEISVPSYGDYARGLYGTLDYGDEVTLLVQKGDYLIRVSAASVGANPTAKAEKILESILVKI